MRESQASRTAEFMALFRALESSRPAGQRLLYDPFAHHFLSPPLRAVTNIARVEIFHAMISRYIDARWPGARTSGIARTRLIDDLLNTAVHDGIWQVVPLGAGFDCRA
jgi:methyltransferase (TIGR00027 family)